MNRLTNVMLRTAVTHMGPMMSNIGRALLMLAMLLNMLFIQPAQLVAAAGNPVPVQTYYVPFPENQLLQGLQSIEAGGQAFSPVTTYISLAAVAGNTIIYYDQWENGYDADIANPGNLYSASNLGGTQIWGDGITANGAPPGVPSDVINPGTVIILNNSVSISTPLAIDYDGRDKIAATKNIAMTRTGWAAGTGTLLAGAVEVYNTLHWGTLYQAPVGENIPDSTDYQMFSYTGLAIMAGAGGATIQIDANADNSYETTVTLAEGQSHFVNGSVNVGAKVSSNNPVQVDILTGDRASTFESRDSALLPVASWSNKYYTPVSTPATVTWNLDGQNFLFHSGTTVWLYNPGASSISVTYERRVGGTLTPTTLTVPAGSYLKQEIPSGTGASFSSTQSFYAFSTADSNGTDPSENQAWDWGFSLIPQSSLTPQVLIGLGIGRDPTSGLSPTENGNPVWITPIGNGNTSVPVYVDYDSNPATGALTDPNGNRYDVSYNLRELDQQKIFDPGDRNQTGMLVYALTQGVKLAAAWGQDPLVANPGAPGLDVGTSVPPIALFGVGKNGALEQDNNGDGFIGSGDELEYTIVINNISRAPVTDVILQDNLPASLTYVSNTTFKDATQIPDGGSTAFPLDEGGVNVGTIPVGGSLTVTFHALIVTPLPASTTEILNTGSATAIGITVPFDDKTLLGGIGDFVWNDFDIDGIQDAGETGMPGVVVKLYNGIGNILIATATTDSTGHYAFTGLETDNYIVEFVKPAGYNATPQDQGANDALDSDAHPTTGRTAAIAWAAGQSNATVDAGFWTPTPSIDIQKGPDTQTVNYSQMATFQIVVTNTGNVALTNVSVSDPLAPNCSASIGNLAVGANHTYTCSFANVTSNFTNVATVNGVYNSTPATDNDSADVALPPDGTVPTASPTQAPALNAAGWNNTDVTVTWNWTDEANGSGIDAANCTMSTISSGEGDPLTLAATCRDLAGNTGNASFALKVDKTGPTMTGSRLPAPNANGWNNSDVTVHFDCTDALSGLVAGSPPADTVLSGEGTSLSAMGACYDIAGNSASDTQSGIKIDKTAPNTSLMGPTDWTHTDVTLTLNAFDALSGVSATHFILDGGQEQSGTSIAISTEGIHTIEYWSVDTADNVEEHHTAEVKIDKTAPTITHTQAPIANVNGWNNGDVTVTFICGDNLSGLASCTDPQPVTTEGQAQQVIGTAVDNAGNSATDAAMLSIDKTAPAINASTDRSPNANGWYNDDLLVSFTCADSLSGIAVCPDAQTLGEGANQSASGTAMDAAENSAEASLNGINVDKTSPTLTGAATPAANANGWYNGDVTVTWTCSDDLSGIDGDCPADSLIGGEGNNLSANVSVSDLAGNITNTTYGVQIDRTAPSLTASATVGGNPYLPGTWTNQNVKVTFVCTDELAGVASVTDPIVVSAEGIAQSATGTCTDKAGNSASTTFDKIQIDKNAPELEGSVAPSANGAGWNNTDVTVTWSCNDALSGLSEPCPAEEVFTEEGTGFSTSATISDQAGNSTTRSVDGINIDRTAPLVNVSATKADNTPYIAGTWTNQTVTVHFDCSDESSGMASCPANLVYSADGITPLASATATDQAGNSTSAGLGPIQIDKIGPTLSPVVTPSNIPLNGTATVTSAAADALSGLASQSCGTLDTSTFGAKTVTCTATDNAGNTSSADASYSVVWNFTGFFQPVDNLPTFNTVKAGLGVPIKFSLGGNQGLNIFLTGYPKSQPISCSSTDPVDGIEETVTAGSSSLSYDPAADQYIYVWKTDRAWAGTCRAFVMKLGDGSTHQANFKFTR